MIEYPPCTFVHGVNRGTPTEQRQGSLFRRCKLRVTKRS
jgi:hypothetical protein